MYEAFNIVYDRMMEESNIRLYKKLHDYLGNKKDMKVAEIACGTGTIAMEFAKNGCDVDASDISKEMIEKAKKKNSFDNCNFSVEDLRVVNYQDKKDLIYCVFDGFSYLPNDTSFVMAIENISKYIKSGGYLIFDYFSYDSYKHIYGELKEEQKYFQIDENNEIFWVEKYKDMDVDVEMRIYEKLPENKFKVYKEEQHQHMYRDETIMSCLKKDFDIEKIEEMDIRTMVYARRKIS